MKRAAAVLVLSSFALLVPGASHASTFYAYGEFKAAGTLPKWPCGNAKACFGGILSGTFNGVVQGQRVSLPMSSTYVNYTDPDVITTGCPLAGGLTAQLSVGTHTLVINVGYHGPFGSGGIFFDGHLGQTDFAIAIASTGFCQPLSPASAKFNIAGTLYATG